MLGRLHFDEKIIRRVSYLVGHHHTYDQIDGLDYQILVEADFLVNLYEDGVISGTSATTYAPNDTLTWAAALKLLLVSNGDLKAADATGADWSKNVIAKAAELGLVAADLDGAKAISRLEFCQVAAKLNKLAESKTESKFTDCTDGYVMALVDAKVINGMTETTFEPDASLTRAQIAKIIYQLNLIEK